MKVVPLDARVRAFRNACRHRGMQVASGSGCTRAFACRYRGWTYNRDGGLRHISHGFPGFDKEAPSSADWRAAPTTTSRSAATKAPSSISTRR